MHRDRNSGSWPELKAKRHNKFDNEPLDSSDAIHSHSDKDSHETQKVRKDRATKHLTRVETMFKDMVDYDNKQGNTKFSDENN
jgi:hypothetical protein